MAESLERREALLHGLAPVAVGLAVGLAGALAAIRLLAGLLYGVRPTDPATFVGVALVLATVGLVATYVPAYRAGRFDPAAMLRAE